MCICVIVNLHYQLIWIGDRLGDTPLGVSVRAFQRGLTEVGRLTLNLGSTIQWARILH